MVIFIQVYAIQCDKILGERARKYQFGALQGHALTVEGKGFWFLEGMHIRT